MLRNVETSDEVKPVPRRYQREVCIIVSIDSKSILVEYVLIFKAQLEMDGPTIRPLFESFETCQHGCHSDVITALIAFAEWFETDKRPTDLSHYQWCFYSALENYFADFYPLGQ